MKTTIITRTRHPAPGGTISPPFRLINLLLAGSYLVAGMLLTSPPVHHGFGGMGGGMGNAAVTTVPALILCAILIALHLFACFIPRYRISATMTIGIGLIISGTLFLSLLFFVRPYGSLLQEVHPAPVLVPGSLALSLLMGILLVAGQMKHGHPVRIGSTSAELTPFPLPESRYQNVRILAEGGVGVIWYAERAGDGLPVVVKVPRTDDEMTGISFMQEISTWKDLEHPHIATVLSANILPVPYIEIEYLPSSLAEIEKPVPFSRAATIIRCLVNALVYAHGRGVAHCDIKPSNILLTREGVPKLTDWGLARSGSSRWSIAGFSPRHAAPEQHHKNPECGFPTDIWQAGLVFSELLTGQAGIPSGTETIFLTEPGAGILPVIRTCLAPDPKDRYPSAEALMDDLNRLLPPE